MPGARNRVFRSGDSAELLAEFLLARVAFISRVPRQEDVGHDLLCSLIERQGELLKAGPFCAVQVKSNAKPVLYQRPHEVDWICHQENPFFIAVVKAKEHALEMYSTWNMLNAILKEGAPVIKLIPGEPGRGELIKRGKDNSFVSIYLGKPILRLTVEDIVDDDKAQGFGAILREWVVLDRENISRRGTKMYWVVGPGAYETNLSPSGSKMLLHFYWNPSNLNHCGENFVKTGVALLRVLEAITEKNGKTIPFRAELVKFFETNSHHFGPEAKKILRHFGKLTVT